MKFFKKMKGWVVIGLCLSAITAILTSVPAYVAAAEGNLKQPFLVITIIASLGTLIFVLIAGPFMERLATKNPQIKKRLRGKN